MKRFWAATALVVVALTAFALTGTASATNGVLDEFTTAYPGTAGTALANCSTCHTSVPALNPYGSAVRAAGMNFAGIEGLDSDGDGFSNLQEIRNLINPGNAADNPSTTPPATTGTTTTTSTTTTTPAAPPPPVAATPAPVAKAVGAPSGAIAFDAGAAGTVWLAVEDRLLVVDRVDTTWDFRIEMDDDGEVEITFRDGEQEVEFEAELEDGIIKTKVESERSDHDSDDDDDDDDHFDGHDDDHDNDDHGGGDHDDDDENDHDD